MKNKGLILALSLILIAQIKHNKAGLQLYYSFEELPKDKSGKEHKGKVHSKINLKAGIASKARDLDKFSFLNR